MYICQGFPRLLLPLHQSNTPFLYIYCRVLKVKMPNEQSSMSRDEIGLLCICVCFVSHAAFVAARVSQLLLNAACYMPHAA